MANHDLTFHADNEPMFREADAPSSKRVVLIASVSFGQTRTFSIRRLYAGDRNIEVDLSDGDVITMEGLMQDNYHHSVSAAKKVASSLAPSSSSAENPNVRYNLTFRRVMRHIPSCTHHS